jgi:hypothetical protein
MKITELPVCPLAIAFQTLLSVGAGEDPTAAIGRPVTCGLPYQPGVHSHPPLPAATRPMEGNGK